MKPPAMVLIDSREQAPLDFGAGIAVETRALKAADYSTPTLDGLDAVERKSPSDFLGTFFGERERRDRQLARLASLRHRAIVVEASLEEVIRLRGGVHVHAVVDTVASLVARHGCPVLFADDRTLAARLVLGVLARWEAA